MFLPVLLIRDLGTTGFVLFVVPNVVGAAAMGWIIRSPELSARLVSRHPGACTAFSAITIIFHCYFFGWLTAGWLSIWPIWLAAMLGIMIAPIVVSALTWPWQRGLAIALLAATAITLLVSQILTDPEVRPPDGRAAAVLAASRLPEADALWLAPVVIFGFALCPYLDITFHRARRSLRGAQGPLAFSLGFGLFFLGLILLTAGYAGYFLWGVQELRWLVFAHIFAQTAFTVGVHLREVLGATNGPGDGDRDYSGWGCVFLPAALLVLVFVPLALPLLSTMPITGIAAVIGRPSLGEIGYRGFLAAYGLLFPAYVWLLMIPTRDGHSGTRGPQGVAKVRFWVLAMALAAPFYWMGFIERQTVWVLPGLLIVLLARLALPRGNVTPANAERSTAPRSA